MATVVNGNQVRLNDGKVVTAQQGGWYDGQQFWGGTLSNPGQINTQSNQQGAGQAVSQQVIAQTAPQNVSYVNEQRQQLNLPPAPDANNPTPVPVEQTVAPQTSGGFLGLGGAGGTSGSGVVGTAGLGITPTPSLNLPALYERLSQEAGIADIENELTSKAKAFADAQSKINDNPWLSEANRVGRIQKLTNDYNNNIKNTQDQLAMKKQDIQTQLDLQMKQFDINSQAAKQALDQFNVLLESGALAGASGQDIAAITAQTGMSSSMIQSAINATKQKNLQTSTISFDDGTNQGFAVINSQTGEIISKQIIGASKPASGGSGVLNDTRELGLEKDQAPQVLLAGAKMGKTLDDMMQYGLSLGLDPNDIYRIYASVNYYHATPEQVKNDKKRYGIK